MLRSSAWGIALLVGAGLVSATHSWVGLAERAGVGPPSALSRVVLRKPLERETAVRARLAAALDRRRRAEELAVAVVEGRLTLHEGASALHEMYRAAPDFPWHTVRWRFPGASDEECACRLLITELRALGGPGRERARAVALRLEAELDGGPPRDARADGDTASDQQLKECECDPPADAVRRVEGRRGGEA
jgi:hypothetical protein